MGTPTVLGASAPTPQTLASVLSLVRFRQETAAARSATGNGCGSDGVVAVDGDDGTGEFGAMVAKRGDARGGDRALGLRRQRVTGAAAAATACRRAAAHLQPERRQHGANGERFTARARRAQPGLALRAG